MSLNNGQGGGVGEDNLTPTGGGGGVAPGFTSRGWVKDVFGFDIFNSGIFFRLRKFGNSFFGWLDSWWCLHIEAAKHKHLISNLLFVSYNLMLYGKY